MRIKKKGKSEVAKVLRKARKAQNALAREENFTYRRALGIRLHLEDVLRKLNSVAGKVFGPTFNRLRRSLYGEYLRSSFNWPPSVY